ncbi:MAG: transcription-repair coupling factor, partial [Polyangiaceae bacterium]
MTGPLTSTLTEHLGASGSSAGDIALAAEEIAPPEPIDSILPPEGVVAARISDVAAAARTLRVGRIDVAGVRGCAGAAVAAAIARDGRRVVFVAQDLEAARRAAEDVSFLVHGTSDEDAEDTGEGDVLVFAANESSPYAGVNPDRRAAMSRMATLFHLAHERPWRVLLVPACGLARKVVPRGELAKRADRILAESEIDRDALVLTLVESGYLRVPIVEDPGSFAVRGALLDVWPPSSDAPVRVELYGQLILSLKPFDPADQKTKKDAAERKVLWLPPVREAILDARNVARARDCVTQLAEAIDWPTTKTRTLADDVANGRPFFGADGFLPAYYEDLASPFDYIPEDAVVILDDPPSVTRALRDELTRAATGAGEEARRMDGPSFPIRAFFREEDDVARDLESRAVVALHRTAIGGASEGGMSAFETSTNALDLASRDHDDLTRAMKSARSSKGKSTSLAPLVRRVEHWQRHGLAVIIAARSQTQAERIVTLLHHQGVECRVRLGPFDPGWMAERHDHALIVVGPLRRGAVLPADGLALVTEEE